MHVRVLEVAEAERYQTEALEIQRRVYGPEHPKVAIRAKNIGTILRIEDIDAPSCPKGYHC